MAIVTTPHPSRTTTPSGEAVPSTELELKPTGGPAESPFESVWETLRDLEVLIEGEFTAARNVGTVLSTQLRRLIDHFCDAERSLLDALAHSEALSLSHADASVRSAQIIEELERTKSELSEARRLAEQQREDRLRLLGRVFEFAQEGIAILNSEARVQEANPVFLKIARRQESDVVDRPLTSILEWAFPEYGAVLRSVLSGEPWTGRVVIANGDQDERSYLISFSPVQNAGQPPNVIVMLSDVSDIERTQRRLKRQALHDQLTGLPNRRFYRERIRSLIEDCRRDNAAFAACFIDLDDFKRVNDTLGHNAGDELLIEVARRLRKHAGKDAFVARFGGDEFALLIPNIDADVRKTAVITDRVMRALREPICVADTEACIGASVGVTEYPTHSFEVDELLQNADFAMYAAKRAGRNQICRFSPEMRRDVEQRHQIHTELQRALHGNEISLHYQPQVCLPTGELAGCEALARWCTPDGRHIAPAEFLPVAEKSGLIIPLGDLVLLTACRQIREWEALGCRPPQVAVNISAHHLHSPGFVDRVAEILAETGTRPEWIQLEMTENAVMADVQHAMRTMDRLVDMGLTLALDDFGTGHSSLSYLKLFNIQTLKVDRSFVKDLPVDERAESIVKSIVHLGQGRALDVVAEGIETQDQYERLRDVGCDIGQGYYIARPLRPTEFESWWDISRV